MTEDLKLAIKHQLKSLGVSSTIDQLLRDLQISGKPVGASQALELLQERGIIEQLAKSITIPASTPAPNPPATSPYLPPSVPFAPSTSGGRRFLQIKVLGGSAFTDYLTRAPLPGEQLCLSLECFGQRLDMAPVPACTEPAFRGEVFLEIPEPPPPPHAGQQTQQAQQPGAAGSAGACTDAGRHMAHVVSGGGGALAGGPEVGASMRLLSLRQPIHIVVASATPTLAQLQAQHQTQQTDMKQQQQQQQQQQQTQPLNGLEQEVAQQSCLQRVVVGLGLGEWRTVLLRRRPVVVSVQLGSGPGAALGLPVGATAVGVLQLQLALHPKTDVALDEPLLVLQQRGESARDAEAAAGFIARARAWWAGYVRLNVQEFKHRPIKVLARGEDGAMVPSPAFVRPLQLGRLLPTPRHASRVVALLRPRDDDAHAAVGLTAARAGCTENALLDGDVEELESKAAAAAAAASTGLGAECWCGLHTLLVGRCGSQEEQAVLLCSLLLGFGLDAYVCVGRLRNGAGHMWVVTRGAFFSTTHWEPSNGSHYSSLQGPSLCPYLSVGSLFNDHSVWANCQDDDCAATTSYVLEEPQLWRELRVGVHDRPALTWSALPLRAPRVNALSLEVWLEGKVRDRMTHHCTHLWSNPPPPQQPTGSSPQSGVAVGPNHSSSGSSSGGVVWDDGLEHLLMPALEAYEHEALTGEVAPGNEEFQSAIKRAVPLGWVFKGVPLHHRSLSPEDISVALLADAQVMAVLARRAPEMALALRVRVFTYPEDLFSIWVMLAAKYKGTA